MPIVGSDDVFEQNYRARLDSLLSPYGQRVRYEQDRAALDGGIHLFEPGGPDGSRIVGQVRVWYQAKGLRSSTLAESALAGSPEVAVSGLRIDDVKYWYAAAEPVYLIVFVESVDEFLAEDVRDLVDRQGGMESLADLPQAQQTMTLKVRRSATLEEALKRMPLHRSLRVDGPAFRGRPLGHRYDPLRSELDPLAPADFEELVNRVLAIHDYRPSSHVAIADALDHSVGTVSATRGKLYFTYEWTSPLFSEFGYDLGTDFRLEAPPHHAHGDILVVIHSDCQASASPTDATSALVEELRASGISQALVFFNGSEMGQAKLFGRWRVTLDPLVQVPQGLGSLAFNVLTATNVYLEFVDRLRWRYVNYL
jgi:hypothetical protein